MATTTGREGKPAPERVAPGVEVRRGQIPDELVDGALRLLHLDLITRGANADEIGKWLWSVHWFPHLRDDPAIRALAEALPPEWRQGEICEPQILLQFPHSGPEPQIKYHLDQEPDWAQGRRYSHIVGIALSRWDRDNGGLLIETPAEPIAVTLAPGDVVRMEPQVSHSGGINRTGSIRYAVYFRWLQS